MSEAAVDRFKKLIRGTIDLVAGKAMTEDDAKIHLEFETEQLVEGKNIIISELKQENEQLKNSQSQKQKIKLHEKIEQLEVEKAEVLEVYKELLLEAMDLYNYYPNNFRKTVRKYFQIDIEFLAKHGVNL